MVLVYARPDNKLTECSGQVRIQSGSPPLNAPALCSPVDKPPHFVAISPNQVKELAGIQSSRFRS